jgi:hypothetical protein
MISLIRLSNILLILRKVRDSHRIMLPYDYSCSAHTKAVRVNIP